MNLGRVKQWWPLVGALVGVLVGYLLYYPYGFSSCIQYTKNLECVFNPSLESSFSGPLYVYTLRLIPVALFAIFIPRFVFNFWLKFSLVWLGVSILVISYFDVHAASGMFLTLFSYDRMDAAKFMANAFVVVSAVMMLCVYTGLIGNGRERKPGKK